MKKSKIFKALLISILFTIFNCNKDQHCPQPQNSVNHNIYHSYTNLPISIPPWYPPGLSSTSGCDLSVVIEPLNGTVQIPDSSMMVYQSDAGFQGMDQFTYLNFNCQEIEVEIMVWTDSTSYCSGRFENLSDCHESNFSISGSLSATFGTYPFSFDCAQFVSSVEILEQPTVGVVEIDGGIINYTVSHKPGTSDKFTYQVCAQFNGIEVCKKRTKIYNQND